VKEELNKDMKNLSKKNQTEILEIKSPFSQIKNTVKAFSFQRKETPDNGSFGGPLKKIQWKATPAD
jgi:hypothetical protein